MSLNVHFSPRINSILYLLLFLSQMTLAQNRIDRKAIVEQNNVSITQQDSLSSLSLGNGRFVMTMDVTGLQTFPESYKNGIPLGTQSEWGWHSFPTMKSYKIEESLAPLEFYGRDVPYARQFPSSDARTEGVNYIRQNPHRIHLANIGWYFVRKNGHSVSINDIKKINQTLDLYKGELVSNFEIDNIPVKVISIIAQNDDALAVKVESILVSNGSISVRIRYPYPTDNFLDEGCLFKEDELKRLTFEKVGQKALIVTRNLDTTQYQTHFASENQQIIIKYLNNGLLVTPKGSSNTWSFTVHFLQKNQSGKKISFENIQNVTEKKYHQYWQSGGMIDFGKTKDPRARELERRMILSLYLTKINCGGMSPPQETGLTYNSWFGKPHMEMIWWHGVHFALWGRPEILENQMSWYFRALDGAKKIAQRQGFKGARWQKMTDNQGQETASSVGSYLLWQQPHLIYFAELLYSLNPTKEKLMKYSELVEQTAEFMADFAHYDASSNRYILGPGVIAAQERFDPKITTNPTYEVAYWEWALETAQKWKQRIGESRNEKWDDVLNKMSKLPQNEEVYLGAETAPDSYTNPIFMTDHPSVLATYGMLPATKNLDIIKMKRTYDLIQQKWDWDDTWGWDFPMVAMTAARLGDPEKAVDALLMPIKTNTYLVNGHNYQTPRLRLYLPGNGGLLTALGMMAIGTKENPKLNLGFPSSWLVQSEGLLRMP